MTCNYMDDCWRNLIAELKEQAEIKTVLKDELKENNKC